MELSVASAFAMSVLEQPGGPYSSTPLGGEMPREAKSSGRCRGHSTTCWCTHDSEITQGDTGHYNCR
jgi:hypothetical protein